MRHHDAARHPLYAVLCGNRAGAEKLYLDATTHFALDPHLSCVSGSEPLDTRCHLNLVLPILQQTRHPNRQSLTQREQFRKCSVFFC